MSRATAVKSIGSDQVWPLSALHRAIVIMSSVLGRDVIELRLGFERV
jgi:hypothetical protein